MIVTISLVNTSTTSHSYYGRVSFFFAMRTFKVYFLSTFHVCNKVLLTIITRLYIRASELILVQT